jgi:hypothetical protein
VHLTRHFIARNFSSKAFIQIQPTNQREINSPRSRFIIGFKNIAAFYFHLDIKKDNSAFQVAPILLLVTAIEKLGGYQAGKPESSGARKPGGENICEPFSLLAFQLMSFQAL